MSNSAITQQVQGLATPTSPGLVGTGAQSFAGVKTFQDAPVIGSASGIAAASGSAPGVVTTGAQSFAGKKTFEGGALIKGDTTGNAIGTGFVGEALYNSQIWTGQAVNPSQTLTTGITITPGIWLVMVHGAVDANVPTQMTVALLTPASNDLDTLGKNVAVRQGNNNGGATGHASGYLRIATSGTYKATITAVVGSNSQLVASITAIRIA